MGADDTARMIPMHRGRKSPGLFKRAREIELKLARAFFVWAFALTSLLQPSIMQS